MVHAPSKLSVIEIVTSIVLNFADDDLPGRLAGTLVDMTAAGVAGAAKP